MPVEGDPDRVDSGLRADHAGDERDRAVALAGEPELDRPRGVGRLEVCAERVAVAKGRGDPRRMLPAGGGVEAERAVGAAPGPGALGEDDAAAGLDELELRRVRRQARPQGPGVDNRPRRCDRGEPSTATRTTAAASRRSTSGQRRTEELAGLVGNPPGLLGAALAAAQHPQGEDRRPSRPAAPRLIWTLTIPSRDQ